jgi:mannose-6-phosphate isomerase-like protein (cupin superfamily)
MGSLVTNLAETKETNGAYCFIEALLKPGHEPPPHVHSREDELFYVLEGRFDVYVGAEAFQVKEGGCVFLPRMKPHAFIVQSARIRLLTIFSPGGLEEAFRDKNTPALSLSLPTGAINYSTEDIAETALRLAKGGVRILAPDEIAQELPLYPRRQS